MYRLTGFGSMIMDRVRMEAYTEALRRTITPDSIVLDIGTGTGIFALIACQLGARHVYAIDPNPLIDLGKQFAAVNGFADRITFIQDFSTRVELPEKADIVIGDLRGQLPYLNPNISSFHDARRRLLKPGGVTLPTRDALFAGYVSSEQQYQRLILSPWKQNDYQLDMQAALRTVVNTAVHKFPIARHEMALPGKQWDTIEYGTRFEPDTSATVEWVIESPATVHFLCLWFDATVIDGVSYSGAPYADNSPDVYGHTIYPLEKPLSLQPGQLLRLTIEMTNMASGPECRWCTEVFASPGETQVPLVKLVQSTFFATPLHNLYRRALHFTPKLNRDGRIQAFVLSKMVNGNMPLEQIAHAALAQFSDLGWDYPRMLARVADVSQTYSE